MIDISRADLEEILLAAERRAWRRRFGDMRCADVMSRDVVTITPDATLEVAWSQLAHHRVEALPVVQAGERLVGIITLHDFLIAQDMPWRTVGEVMTQDVFCASPTGRSSNWSRSSRTAACIRYRSSRRTGASSAY